MAAETQFVGCAPVVGVLGRAEHRQRDGVAGAVVAQLLDISGSARA